jgi:hypothetical protein
MKIKDGYLLREIADCCIVVPIGERVIDFKGMMTLNETGAFLWKNLSNDISHEQLLQNFIEEYEVDKETAKTDLHDFLCVARKNGVLDE